MCTGLDDAGLTPLELQQLQVAGTDGDTFWHRVRFRLVADTAARLGATTVLDVGAGSGGLGAWLAANRPGLGYRFQESSPTLDARLVERFGTPARTGDGDPIPAGTLVALLDVLEHVDDDRLMLAQLRDRMAPGGAVLVTVPAFQWAFTSWDTALGHHRRYSARQLRECAAAAGLEVDATGYLFPELLPLIAVRKLRRAQRRHAEFPSLPRAVDRTAEVCGRATTTLRRIWPGGTSATALLRRSDTNGAAA